MDEKVSFFEGFLHETAEGQWLLCDAPNLKSCCLTKHEIVALEGDYSRYATGQAVSVEGVLVAGTLHHVQVQEKNSSFPYWSLGAVVLLLFLLTKWRKGRLLLP